MLETFTEDLHIIVLRKQRWSNFGSLQVLWFQRQGKIKEH